MVRVAVAGGTSGLGRLVVDAIVATKKHDVFVLSRKESDVFASKPNVKLFAVNYAVPATITAVLEKNRVGTVISCLHLNSKEASDVQLNLIEGVGKTVERFAPSKFGLDYLEVARVDFEFHAIEFKVIAVNKLKEFPSLTYTRFITGTFMDFFGPLPNLLINVASLIIKPRNRKAAILGDGSATIESVTLRSPESPAADREKRGFRGRMPGILEDARLAGIMEDFCRLGQSLPLCQTWSAHAAAPAAM
ncbi:hypothetical protein GMDG_05853 [Pseudogymnoascus destructans 20631-21]|uniref:NmrA-like domain-containing protein n=1 Tax=Pseudogymnoascus destructans (strain ATCC MYA-4855 / 20631-21) TaxID=658429 RepID=L8FR99_PSED2|nr:hypothetical protein GMDG_05853 [Pseudogymnoascus destructans 20631-21]